MFRSVGDLFALGICEHYKIEGGIPSVCKGAIDMMSLDLLPSVADGILSSQRICDETLGFCKNPKIIEKPVDQDVKRILSTKPDFLNNNDYVDQLYEKIKNDPNKDQRKVRRSIHMSDLHIDVHY
jgi:hypothetical protein